MGSTGFARGCLAAAAASLAIFSLVYGDFAPGGLSLPALLPARGLLTHACAVLVLVASVGLLFTRTAPVSALLVGAYELIWVLISAPAILSGPLTIGAWYPICEALTAFVGTWILVVILRPRFQGTGSWATSGPAVRVAQALFGLTCIFYGVSHFAYAKYTASMVPAWLPGQLGLAYVTGLGHIAAGISIVFGILSLLGATLEAIMMSLFGLLVWVPTFFAQPKPEWATPPQNQWSELVVNIVLAASAWIVAVSLRTPSPPPPVFRTGT